RLSSSRGRHLHSPNHVRTPALAPHRRSRRRLLVMAEALALGVSTWLAFLTSVSAALLTSTGKQTRSSAPTLPRAFFQQTRVTAEAEHSLISTPLKISSTSRAASPAKRHHLAFVASIWRVFSTLPSL